MPVLPQTLAGGEQQAYKALKDSISSLLRVAMPGIIKSYNAQTVTCTVQPAIMGMKQDAQGNFSSVKMPLLVDVPVVFPRGGGVSLTFPVKAEDECLVIFADRCIDFWWQSGDVQLPVDPRQHDLSDAFAIVGPQSQKYKISNISASAAQLRSDDGAAIIEIDPASHAVNVTTSGDLAALAQGAVTITSPTITLNGNVTINGNLSQGMGEAGGAASMRGPVTVANNLTAGGISLETHTHSGVETGNGTTGGPQ